MQQQRSRTTLQLPWRGSGRSGQQAGPKQRRSGAMRTWGRSLQHMLEVPRFAALHGYTLMGFLGSHRGRQATAAAGGSQNHGALAMQGEMARGTQGSSASRSGTPALTGRTAWRWSASHSALPRCRAIRAPLRCAPPDRIETGCFACLSSAALQCKSACKRAKQGIAWHRLWSSCHARCVLCQRGSAAAGGAGC